MLATAATAAAQSSIIGTAVDSLSTRTGEPVPLRNATIVLVSKSRYTTTDSLGRFRFDSVPAGRQSIGLLHEVLDSFDLVLPHLSIEVPKDSVVTVELATPSAATAFLAGCAERLNQAVKKADVVQYLRVRAACNGLARRAEQQAGAEVASGDSTTHGRAAQPVAAVVVRDSMRTLSPMQRDGFEARRKRGLGTFITPEFLAKNNFSTLSDLLHTTPVIHVEYGTAGFPYIYLHGNKEGYCVPTFFIDGLVFDPPRANPALRPPAATGTTSTTRVNTTNAGNAQAAAALANAYADLSALAPPHLIKAVEIYASPGTAPSHYDRSSMTGCGSVVIWTR